MGCNYSFSLAFASRLCLACLDQPGLCSRMLCPLVADEGVGTDNEIEDASAMKPKDQHDANVHLPAASATMSSPDHHEETQPKLLTLNGDDLDEWRAYLNSSYRQVQETAESAVESSKKKIVRRFAPEEDAIIEKAVQDKGTDSWDDVAMLLVDRNARYKSCLSHGPTIPWTYWQTVLNQNPPPHNQKSSQGTI